MVLFHSRTVVGNLQPGRQYYAVPSTQSIEWNTGYEAAEGQNLWQSLSSFSVNKFLLRLPIVTSPLVLIHMPLPRVAVGSLSNVATPRKYPQFAPTTAILSNFQTSKSSKTFARVKPNLLCTSIFISGARVADVIGVLGTMRTLVFHARANDLADCGAPSILEWYGEIINAAFRRRPFVKRL